MYLLSGVLEGKERRERSKEAGSMRSPDEPTSFIRVRRIPSSIKFEITIDAFHEKKVHIHRFPSPDNHMREEVWEFCVFHKVSF